MPVTTLVNRLARNLLLHKVSVPVVKFKYVPLEFINVACLCLLSLLLQSVLQLLLLVLHC